MSILTRGKEAGDSLVPMGEDLTRFVVQDKLITLVKSYPIIYSKLHNLHGHKMFTGKAWKEIFFQLGTQNYVKSDQECEKMWKSLRTQYRTFKKKMATKSGQARANKLPTFQHQEAMREFDEKEMAETTFSNVSSCGVDQNSEGNSATGTSIIDENTRDTTSSKDASRAFPSKDNASQDYHKVDSHTVKGQSLPARSEAGYKRKVCSSGLEESSWQMKAYKQTIHMDENAGDLDYFGKRVAQKLRRFKTMNADAALQLELEINQLLVQKERELVRNKPEVANSADTSQGRVKHFKLELQSFVLPIFKNN